MKLWKYSGIYLWATGVIHTIFGLAVMGKDLWAIVRGGFVNTAYTIEQAVAVWFLVCGIIIIFLGVVLQHYIAATGKPAPMFLGTSLLVFSAICCAMMPVSGFWLFIPQAIVVIAANRKQAK